MHFQDRIFFLIKSPSMTKKQKSWTEIQEGSDKPSVKEILKGLLGLNYGSTEQEHKEPQFGF